MNTAVACTHRTQLRRIAVQAMRIRGLEPDFPPQVLAAMTALTGPAQPLANPGIRDLRDLLWCSIDNDDSRDLDQATVAVLRPDGAVRILVAIADVDSLVKTGSAIDVHAWRNTTAVYTAGGNFPLLPERLSTDLTSLGPETDRLAVVVELVLDPDHGLQDADIFPALVRNQAQLAYHTVGPWLAGNTPVPPSVARVSGLEINLQLQDRVAQGLHKRRQQHGALDLEPVQVRPVFAGEALLDLVPEVSDRAKSLIAEFMIAANEITVRYLKAHNAPALRRVVRTPKSWDRIVALAAEHGGKLPATADVAALGHFLVARRAADPVTFADLSLAVIKLLGRGEYVAQHPGRPAPGHFALAVGEYTHATAPNRRYPDLISQRLVKAVWAGVPCPYDAGTLDALATHCTTKEDAARKVERQVGKSAAALLIGHRLGERFAAIVTGASEKGTWVRTLHPPVEGFLVAAAAGLAVGRRLTVELVRVDVERGFIDFAERT